MSTSGNCNKVEKLSVADRSSDNKFIAERVEQALQTRIVSEDIVANNPIFHLMRRAAIEFFNNNFANSGVAFHFYYVLDFRVNAYTLKFDNDAVICFTTGAIEHISEIFTRIVDLDDFRSIFSNRESPKLIADLSVNAFYFLFFHELGHLICGHAGYTLKKESTAFMAMFEDVKKPSLLDRQTFEVQADVIAANYFNSIIRNDNKIDLPRLEVAISAVYLLFEIIFLFDRGRFASDHLYLPSTYRMTNIFAIIIQNEVEDIKPTFEKVVEATDKGFYYVFRISSKKMQKLKKDSQKIEKHMDTIIDHWRVLYRELEPYAIVKLHPDIYDW